MKATEEQKQQMKEYAKEHSQEIKVRKHKYYENNKIKILQRSRKYYNSHDIKKTKSPEIIKRDWEKMRNNAELWKKGKARRNAVKRIPIHSDCDICQSTQNLQRHHWRYDKPLLVNTLCSTCHGIQHQKFFEGGIR